jgi:hypothetical protein
VSDKVVTWIAAFVLLVLGGVGLYTGYPAVGNDEASVAIALGLIVSAAGVLGIHIRLLNGRGGNGR